MPYAPHLSSEVVATRAIGFSEERAALRWRAHQLKTRGGEMQMRSAGMRGNSRLVEKARPASRPTVRHYDRSERGRARSQTRLSSPDLLPEGAAKGAWPSLGSVSLKNAVSGASMTPSPLAPSALPGLLMRGGRKQEERRPQPPDLLSARLSARKIPARVPTCASAQDAKTCSPGNSEESATRAFSRTWNDGRGDRRP